VGALALAACLPLKPPPEPEPPVELPEFCIPNPAAQPEAALVEPAPEPDCTPICLPGQEPPPDERALAEPAPQQQCIPICPIGPAPAPELSAQRLECIRIPIPCLPGQEPGRETGCVNICLPGQEGSPEAAVEPDVPDCRPLCEFLPAGVPGACERSPEK